MFTPQELLMVTLAALALSLIPGPNMAYCVSRSLTQGRRAGLLSLAGVQLGHGVHLLAAGLGLTALLVTLPRALDVVRGVGAAYLLWIAWKTWRSAPGAALEIRAQRPDRPGALLHMGFLTCLLNPLVALFYLSLIPQFVHPERGQPLLQCLGLGAVHIGLDSVIHTLLVLGAARVAWSLRGNPTWGHAQRRVMAAVLGALALWLLASLGQGAA